MCAKLCIEKAGVMGQSLGAVYALSCARDEGLKEVLGGTTVGLVSPWVPLAAPGEVESLYTSPTPPPPPPDLHPLRASVTPNFTVRVVKIFGGGDS